jgi:LPXTG-motif cell wall-anchored protein
MLMRLRRIGLALAAAVAATVGVVGPAVAAPPVYPPAAGGPVQVIVPGLTLGGSSARAVSVTLSPGSPQSLTLGRGARLMVTLTGFAAGESVSGSVHASCTGRDFDGTFGPYTAGAEGITIGPFQFARPCVYTFTFTGSGMVASLGVGGKVPAAAVAAAATETYTLTVTVKDVAAAGAVSSAALPRTGGSGLAPVWIGLALVVLGGGAYALSRRRGATVRQE